MAQPTAEPHDAPLILAALGDVILSRALHMSDNPLFEVIRSADIASANLEFVLTHAQAEEASDKLIALRAEPALASSFATMGVDVLTVANNHAMDFGAVGLLDTLAAVRDAGMAAVGGGATLPTSLAPHVASVAGKRMAFFGVSTHLPNGSAAGSGRPGIAPVRVVNSYALDPVTLSEVPGMAPFVQTAAVREDLDRLCSSIRQAAESCNLVIVNIHWGVPLGWVATHQDEIAQYQQPLARALVDAGASVVIGHGPHVIQAVEFYRDKPIFYSIGNFVMHDILPAEASAAGYPDYDWDSLRTEWNAIGCIARLGWAGEAVARCELLVTRLDAHGESHAASRADAERLRVRLDGQSRKRGAGIDLRQDGAHWVLAFTPAKNDR